MEDEKFATIQFPYNIVEDQADEVFKVANKKGIGIITMKPLAGGAIDDGALAIKYILSKNRAKLKKYLEKEGVVF